MGVVVEHHEDRAAWERGLANHSTSAAFPSVIPTVTEPATVDSATPTSNCVVFTPSGKYATFMVVGTGADNATGKLRLFRWNSVTKTGATKLWIPSWICDVTATLGTSIGVAGAALIATDRFADGLAVTPAPAATTRDGLDIRRVTTGSANLPAEFCIEHQGAERIGVYFDLNSSATALNVLYRRH